MSIAAICLFALCVFYFGWLATEATYGAAQRVAEVVCLSGALVFVVTFFGGIASVVFR